MINLKFKTIREVINLANRSNRYGDKKRFNPFAEKEIEGVFKPNPDENRLIKFINNLSDMEKAELTALMWLGRDGGEWEDLFSYAREEIEDAAEYLSEMSSLALFLERGINRAYEKNLFLNRLLQINNLHCHAAVSNLCDGIVKNQS